MRELGDARLLETQLAVLGADFRHQLHGERPQVLCAHVLELCLIQGAGETMFARMETFALI
ncbi:hypothetical protein WL77_18125 [Burkholderia ubonensis]|nr:hypothetical protein WL77_18125 [Burkholderia ubonensis]KWE65734.1 hypothetical protein WL79_00965 [Burkholderia ubonensis]